MVRIDCTSCYNENKLYVCYIGLESAPRDFFLKDKVSNAAGGIAIGSNSNTLQSPWSPSDGVDGMDAIPTQFIKSIQVDITQHLANMGLG